LTYITGDNLIVIMDERGKKYLIDQKTDFQSDLGIINQEDISKAKVGQVLNTHLNKEFKVIKPNINDFIELMDRRCSILIQKDIGTIITRCGLGSGSKIVDAGTGAGAIALNFGNIVGKTGHVYSYEIRKDFSEVAKKNIETFGLNDIIEIKNQDIKEGIDEKEIDLVFLDLIKPYDIFQDVYEKLNLGGYLAVYAPYIDQIETSYKVAKKLDFQELAILETLEREIEVRNQGTRPKTRMVGHSGYLMFGRKL
jgi:tRNA (adenine57-N1/adenine58-N1)-methyltransferase catalytic subunit